MKDFFNYLKESLSFLWTPATTENDKQIRIYNIWIFVFVLVIIFGLSGLIYSKYYTKSASYKHQTVSVQYPSIYLKNSMANLTNENVSAPIIVGTNLPPNEFFCGETVGLKFFGVFGVVHEKILTINGYDYIIRYKDNNHEIHDVECYDDELFRPSKDSLWPYVLQN